MKITVCHILLFILHAVFYIQEAATAGKGRPEFELEVKDLIKDMAEANKYVGGIFDRCHIVPWGFMSKMMKNKDKAKVLEFIDDLAKIHDDAAFYKNLGATIQEKIKTYTEEYKTAAKKAVEDGDETKLGESLYNFPSNLYPGKPALNEEVGPNFDPPKQATASKERSNDATEAAKETYKKYKPYGLKIDENSLGKALSSDKPPGDTSEKYITIKL